MTNLLSVIHSDTDILGGTPVFIGTRVPVKTLLPVPKTSQTWGRSSRD